MLDARAPSPLGEREGVRGNEYRGSKIEMRYTQYVIRYTRIILRHFFEERS